MQATLAVCRVLQVAAARSTQKTGRLERPVWVVFMGRQTSPANFDFLSWSCENAMINGIDQ
jgi:hypothetical protein